MTLDRIQIVIPPALTPDWMLTEGSLYLDTYEDFSFSLTENDEELTELNKLKGYGVLGFAVPMSPKNSFIFQDFLSAIVENNSFAPLEILCLAGGYLPLRFDLVFFKNSRDSVRGGLGEIELEIVDSDDFWLTAAQKTEINTIDLGTFTLNGPNLKANWANAIWTEGNDPFWWPRVHYGKTFRPQDDYYGLMSEDFRPWISVPGFLKAAFKAIGWNFDTSLSDTVWWNRLWMYILGSDFDYTNRGASYGGEFTGGYQYDALLPPRPMIWDTVISDPSGGLGQVSVGVFTQTGSSFTNTRPADSDYEFRVEFTAINPSLLTVKFDVALIQYNNNIQLDIDQNIWLAPSETKDVVVTLRGNLGFGQRAYISLQGMFAYEDGEIPVAGGLEVGAGAVVTITPMSNRLYHNDTIDIGSLLKPGVKIIDVLKGIIHLGGFKLLTDYVERTVWLYPVEQTRLYNSTVDGFYLDSNIAFDVTDYISDGSRNIEVKEAEERRYIRIKFKESSDGYIDKEELENDEPLYSKLIDLGSGIEEDPLELENPFFEPMAEIAWRRGSIPACWDETDPTTFSVDIEPRIMYAIGDVELVDSLTVDQPVMWVFETEERTSIPYGAMAPRHPYLASGVPFQSFRSVVYGGLEASERVLYDQFWKFRLQEYLYSKELEFIAVVPIHIFEQMDFRTRLLIRYRGESIYCRQKSKSGYRTGTDNTMQLIIKPDTAYAGE